MTVAILAEHAGAEILRELDRERGGDRRSTGQRGQLIFSEYRQAIVEAGMNERTARRFALTRKLERDLGRIDLQTPDTVAGVFGAAVWGVTPCPRPR
jgi:hypothetical protein